MNPPKGMSAYLIREANILHENGFCLLPATDKKPAVPSWKKYQGKRPTKSELNAMFKKYPNSTGICAVLGKVSSGWNARDFDKKESYFDWVEQFKNYCECLPTAMTGRGFHVYFRSNQSVKTKHFEDGELRGEASILILPPSLHPSGIQYSWLKTPSLGLNEEINPKDTGLDQDWSLKALNLSGNESNQTKTTSTPSTPSIALPRVLPEELKEIENAIKRFLPNDFHQNHDSIFNTVRFLLDLKKRFQWSKDVYEQMHKVAFEIWFQTNKFLNPNNKKLEYQLEWLQAIGCVRFPLGIEILKDAWKTSEKIPLNDSTDRLYPVELARVANFCMQLQILNGKSPFFLSCYSLAPLLETTPVTAWRILKALRDKGFLEMVCKGNRSKANRYRWLKQTQEPKENKK